MTPKQSEALIAAAGGDKAFAELIGIAHEAGFAQRVNNWKRRGIPAAVLLRHRPAIESISVDIYPREKRA